MSSARFPGKVLAPLSGQPVIKHVLQRVRSARQVAFIVVTTSIDPTDDPLAYYLERLGETVHRGPLTDVFARFRDCLTIHACDWILRVSADSPCLDVAVLDRVVECSDDVEYDLVTTTFPRTFPTGQNAELIRASTFAAIDRARLDAHDSEHVTAFYYRNPAEFKIKNVASGDPGLAQQSFGVDTIEDLRRLDQLLADGVAESIVAGEVGMMLDRSLAK